MSIKNKISAMLAQLIPGDAQVRLVERHQELGRELRVLGAVFPAGLPGLRVAVLHCGREDDEEHQVRRKCVTSHFPEMQGGRRERDSQVGGFTDLAEGDRDRRRPGRFLRSLVRVIRSPSSSASSSPPPPPPSPSLKDRFPPSSISSFHSLRCCIVLRRKRET